VYSRAIQIFKNYPNKLLIYGGETYDDRGLGKHVPFSATVVKLTDVLRAPVNGTVVRTAGAKRSLRRKAM
jgi:hypothetical protein